MNEEHLTLETRPVKHFDQVILRDYIGGGELWIKHSDKEILTIEAPKDILQRIRSDVTNRKLVIRVGGSWLDRLNDMLTTSLTRPRVIYRLTVKEIAGIEIFGAVCANASGINTDHLTVRFYGAGEVNIKSLQTKSLEIYKDGAGRIDLAGQATEQRISVKGVGSYDGSKLRSKRAFVELRGTGKISLWAEENLDVRMSGLGRVEYSGNPKVRESISGLGTLVRLGHR